MMGEMPDFEYYDGLNYFLINHYLYLTLSCQGCGYLFSILYHFTSYKYWNLLGTMTLLLGLPVDVLIFWLEPLGSAGTIFAMVLGKVF